MHNLIAVLLFLLSGVTSAVEVPALPGAEFADTEVSTNVALSVGAARNRRLVFSVELQASPSNNVEVAVGCDADADGRLSLAESALVVGYDCGEWFVRSAAKDSAEDRRRLGLGDIPPRVRIALAARRPVLESREGD